MANISRGYTFGATELVTAAKLHGLVDDGAVTGITATDIADNSITAAKIQSVSGATFTNLANVPSGAGVIPSANLDITLASQAEAEAGTNNTKLMTPLRTKEAITANVDEASIISTIYPVGSLYISTLSTNPNTLLGFGTWTAFGAGRVLVGFNSGDTDFNAGEKTGGAKTVNSSHTHSVPRDGWGADAQAAIGRLATYKTGSSIVQATTDNTSGSGGSASLSIVQSYITVYMWKRTA